MVTITKEHVQAWLDAGNTLDPSKLAAIMSDDVVMHQPQNPAPLTKSDMISFFGMLWNAFPDMHFHGEGCTIEGNEAASWERVTGTLTGSYIDPSSGRAIEPTGKQFDLRAAMHLVFDDEGRISSVSIFWDRLAFMQQLGLL